ncbi:MAG: heavy-metal-associated domain-containing protein, partial [Lachnospiraceae bacterium]|nr:heavy-metal-associated domain-containing protein [Lachnospiraceae bacterium]
GKGEVPVQETNKGNTNTNEKGGTMEQIIKVEGMSCGHCENTVKKALEALDGVESASASHEKGEAVVKLSKEVPFEVLKEAIEAKDYKVVA